MKYELESRNMNIECIKPMSITFDHVKKMPKLAVLDTCSFIKTDLLSKVNIAYAYGVQLYVPIDVINEAEGLIERHDPNLRQRLSYDDISSADRFIKDLKKRDCIINPCIDEGYSSEFEIMKNLSDGLTKKLAHEKIFERLDEAYFFVEKIIHSYGNVNNVSISKLLRNKEINKYYNEIIDDVLTKHKNILKLKCPSFCMSGDKFSVSQLVKKQLISYILIDVKTGQGIERTKEEYAKLLTCQTADINIVITANYVMPKLYPNENIAIITRDSDIKELLLMRQNYLN